jgi:two-component system, NtrC family, response regulator AtoC
LPTMKNNILLIEKNHRERVSMREALEEWGYHVATSNDGIDAFDKIKSNGYGLVISDFEIEGISAVDLLHNIKSANESTKILFTSKHASVENAVKAIKAGAFDFVIRPLDHVRMKFLVERAFENHKNGNLKASEGKSVNIVTNNDSVLKMLEIARRVADSTASVFIQGESGTGKELLARYIHENSGRSKKPFIAVNCAALPESLLESELFGHEKGAFTGAISKKPGKFELADGGTILLDEVTEMQFHLQSKLLRIIQEREIDRVGGTHPVKVDIRILCTSNRNIASLIDKGEFREDLYYRLNTIPVTIPPLRKRQDDIALLSTFFIKKYNEIDGRNVKTLTEGAIKTLENQYFKGNVRELENIIQRAILFSDGTEINENDLYLENSFSDTHNTSSQYSEVKNDFIPGPLKEIEKKMIFQTLDKTEGNRTHAAKILGISVRTLRNKLNEYKESLTDV